MIASLLRRISDQKQTGQDYEQILPQFPYDPLTAQIPKIIWRAFITQKPNTPLPEIARETELKLRELNPDYELRMVDNSFVEGFIRKHYGDVVWSYFCRIDPNYGACRADFFRYLLLYKMGGVWIDLKCLCTRPLSEEIQPTDRLLLSHWDNRPGEEHEGWGHLAGLENVERGEYIMSMIPVAAGHPFLRTILIRLLQHIDVYNPHVHNIGFASVIWLSGPVPYTKVALELQQEGKMLEERGDYREVSFAHDFGFVYTLTKLKGLSDYRQNLSPLITHPSRWVNNLNRIYFKLLGFYRRRILKL